MELPQRGRMDGNRRDPRSKQTLPPSKHMNGGHALTNGNSRPSNSQLSLADPAKFQGDFPTFQMPKYIGSFSLNDKREYLNDRSQLRYLAIPPSAILLHDRTWQVDFDLKNGVTCAIEKDENQIRKRMLDDLLKWILQERLAGNWSIFDPVKPNRPLEIELVCFRGLLTMIMASPYEHQEGWTIAAAKFQNTVYLWHLKKVDPTGRDFNNHPRAKEMSIWGFKFEQYLCVDSPGASPDVEERLNTNAEFCCVIKTRLAGRAMLYGAEVDALRPNSQPPWETTPDNVPTMRNFVELKTTRHIENQRQDVSFRKFKLMKWWAQSFLVGVPSVICGYRDDDGVVNEMEEFDVEKLRKMGEEYWMPRVMMNFCNQFLDFVVSAFPPSSPVDPLDTSASPTKEIGDPTQHFIFEFDPRRKTVSCRPGVVGRELSRNILPDWYIQALRQPT